MFPGEHAVAIPARRDDVRRTPAGEPFVSRLAGSRACASAADCHEGDRGAQQLPPRLFFGNPVITRTMLTLVPLIIRIGFLRQVFIDTMRRFAFGQEKVKLTV